MTLRLTLAVLFAFSLPILSPAASRGEQFVLFDVTFTFTKEDADNSKPSKSHYYVQDKLINPDRPKDWTAPVDYRNGTVHIRTEVIEKPEGSEPTTWSLCYIPNRGQKNGYGCTGTVVYREKGVYEQDVSMKTFWQNDSIVWSEGIKQMDLVMKDGSGGSGHAHKRTDSEKFFPTKVRITMVQVSAGAKYDPTLVPKIPVSKESGAKQSKQGKAKVLLIGKQPDHPYGSHMYLHTSRMLAECLRVNGVEAAVSDGWPKDAAELKGVKSIVVYTSPAAELLLDGPHRDEVDRVMKDGVGLVTLHWASSVQKENLDRLGEKWMSYLGGTWISNVGLSTDTSLLKQLDPKHPICRGWKSYYLHDEFYLNPKLGKDAKPLLQVTTKGQDVVVGWAFERPGGGRAYATTLGHFYENFERDAFRRAIVNAILWSAHEEVPEDGARIDIKPDILKLPPDPSKK